MAGFPLMALGAGLGIAADQINKQRQQQAALQMQQQKYAAEMMQLRLALQQFQQKNQTAQDFAALSLPGGAPGGTVSGASGYAATPGENQTGFVSGMSSGAGAGGGFNLSTAGAPPRAAPSPTFGSNAFEPMTAMPSPSVGGGNWETQHNNFAGMRIPGVVAGPNSGGFQSFATPEAGIQGIAHQLDRYASGATTGTPLTTLRQIVSTWAPPNENPTDQLIARASSVMGVSPDQPLDLSNPQVKGKLVEAMIRGEQGGRLPIDPGVIQRAIGSAQPSVEQRVAQATTPDSTTMNDAGPQTPLPKQPTWEDAVNAVAARNPEAARRSPQALALAAKAEFERQTKAFSEQMQLYTRQQATAAQQARAKSEGTQVIETDQGPMIVNRGTGEVRPVQLPGGARVSAGQAGWDFMQRPDGSIIRVNKNTGKVEPVDLPQGTTRLGTAAQAAPDPKTVDYTAKMIADYRMAPLTGWSLRSKFGQQVMSQVEQLNPNYDATKYASKVRGAVAFTTGRQGDAVRSFSVSIDHLAVLDEVAAALANGDTQAINRLGNEIQKQFGYAGPVDFNFVKSVVGDEISKAIIGGVGSTTDRQQLQNGFDLANSPEQLVGVVQMAKRLMAGQLGGYRRQAGTAGFSQEDFEKALSSRAKQELEMLPGGGAEGGAPGGGGAQQPPWAKGAAQDAQGMTIYSDGTGWFHADHSPVQ